MWLRRGSLLLSLILPLALRAQQPWTTVEPPVTYTLWGIVHGNALGQSGQFVAVGEAGTILTSPDGLAWTARTSGTDKWLLGVTWSPTLRVFVVVGDSHDTSFHPVELMTGSTGIYEDGRRMFFVGPRTSSTRDAQKSGLCRCAPR